MQLLRQEMLPSINKLNKYQTRKLMNIDDEYFGLTSER